MNDQLEVADFEDANEEFHRRGWTDGLPVVPPTPERVARFLAAAGLAADHEVGFYDERRIPVTAGKLAINAVMAGCLPEYFPVVVAIMEGMLDPAYRTHVVNSSTGSFTVGFIVNGPIRRQLGMNADGNVLGPGNRANSSIGRAIRLIQLNVLGSIPGAGGPDPAHGRAVLDRSMMGQPAKYAGYHIVENEEAFPELTPLHVEMGFAPEDSTVTLLFVAGYDWLCAHAEQTPEAWIDTMAHYVVHAGNLQEQGYAVLLLPPESAALFVANGWSKQDIRDALHAATRRSVAWLKESGWKVQWQQPRLEPVLPGDAERAVAISGSAKADELMIVVCGGPAGAWPYYLYGGSGAKAITRKVRTAPSAKAAAGPEIERALAGQRQALAADGYGLSLVTDAGGALIATITAGPDACPDCLVPKSMMRRYFDEALVDCGRPAVELIYPADAR